MIKSFRDNRTEALFTTGQGDKKWQSFDRVARRKLLMVDAASSLRDLKSPPANKLEALKDDRSGTACDPDQNGQYRVCFVWADGDAHNVEVVDYH
jgi:proteic killer suppression protein